MGMPRPRKIHANDEASAVPHESHSSVMFVAPLDPALPKTGQVYDAVRKAIVGLTLPPGSIINERGLCERFQISRTPLREAILQLQSENLVTVLPNSGTYVSRIDLQSVFDGQLVRDALEMKVVRLAAARMSPLFERQLDFNMHEQNRLAADLDYDGFYERDEAFHSMICEFGASARIWRIVNGAKAQLDRVRRLAFPAPTHLDIVLREHTAIVDGLKAHDPGAAAAAMKLHLDRVFDTIRRLIVEQSDYFSPWSPEELDSYESAMRDTGRRRRRS